MNFNNMLNQNNVLNIWMCLVVKPGEFTQDITDEGFTKNTTVMFRQFRWNLVCGAYKTQGE